MCLSPIRSQTIFGYIVLREARNFIVIGSSSRTMLRGGVRIAEPASTAGALAVADPCVSPLQARALTSSPATRQFVRRLNLHEVSIVAVLHNQQENLLSPAVAIADSRPLVPACAQYQSAQLMASKGVNVPFGIPAKSVAEVCCSHRHCRLHCRRRRRRRRRHRASAA